MIRVHAHVPLYPVTHRGAIIGSGYRGSVECSYDELVKVFGKPHFGESGDGKVRAEWAFFVGKDLTATDGALRPPVVTVYDYKESKPVKEVTIWNIGARGLEAYLSVQLVHHALGLDYSGTKVKEG